MTDPIFCTAQIDQTVVSDFKEQVLLSYHTAFAAVYQCYLCIFLIAETVMIAARIIFFTNEGRFFYELGVC